MNLEYITITIFLILILALFFMGVKENWEEELKRRRKLVKQEYLLCSAIWYKEFVTQKSLPKNCNKGIVICGWRHGNIIHSVLALTGKRTVTYGENSVGEHEQGFLTNENRFVDRVEAGKVAFKSKQIKYEKKYLFSEDVW